MTERWTWSHIIAWCAIALFVVMQLTTIDYGTHINDLPHIRKYQIASDLTVNSSLTRRLVVEGSPSRMESLDLWMLRFKLYTVESDEVNNIIALARIAPSAFHFDPGYYQYGGAYLYPLGLWYFALTKLGVLRTASLADLLADPDLVDRIWIFGRLFVLAAVAGSAVLLFAALLAVATPAIALIGVLLYLSAPATVMFSQIMKPHWYGLLWVNLSLWVLVRTFTGRSWSGRDEIGVAASLGLAVGSAATFAPYAVLVWGALAYGAGRGHFPVLALIRVPVMALAVLLIANPYYVLSWEALLAERAAAESWFKPSFELAPVVEFYRNSIAGGFGIGVAALLAAVALLKVLRPATAAERLLVAALAIPVILVGIGTANMAAWHFNFRYVPYLLPLAILFLAACRWPGRNPTMVAALLVSLVQAVPMKLAYVDENDADYSTRLTAARWIDSNIPPSEPICLGTTSLAPFDAPPFRFERREIRAAECRWQVIVERDPDSATQPRGFTIAERFRPRFSPEKFPLVWGHINPQITIYRHDG